MTAEIDAPCPACGSSSNTSVPYPRTSPTDLKFQEIAVCIRCGLGIAHPVRSQQELNAFYASGAYWEQTVVGSRAQTLHERNQCKHRVRLAYERLRGRQPIRVLDVGAGHGWTAYWLDRTAPGAVASFEFIEPDANRSQEIIARAYGFQAAPVASLDVADGPYQLIFLNHVLEHVADALNALQRVRTLLAPDGIAYFELPHADYRFKRDVFPHTWFFTPESLQCLGRRAGLNQLLLEPFGKLPTTRCADLLWRAAFRASAAVELTSVAGICDDRVWRYEPSDDGIWLRWLVSH